MALLDRFDRIVRCKDGHLYHTVWMPLGSLKAIRLGSVRYQRCPVDRRWRWTRRVAADQLSPAERAAADQIRDSGIL